MEEKKKRERGGNPEGKTGRNRGKQARMGEGREGGGQQEKV